MFMDSPEMNIHSCIKSAVSTGVKTKFVYSVNFSPNHPDAIWGPEMDFTT
jgi:hypothetical protein